MFFCIATSTNGWNSGMRGLSVNARAMNPSISSRYFFVVGFKSGGVDKFVHYRVLVVHRIKQRVLTVVVPVEEIFGENKPTTEQVGHHRQGLLRQFVAE